MRSRDWCASPILMGSELKLRPRAEDLDRPFIGIALLLALQASVLFFFAHPPICTCGYVKLWEGVVLSSGNSQHLTDWYTFSHVIHGFIFYGILYLLFPKMSVWKRLLIATIATGIEVTWEITEKHTKGIQAY